jgi:hypothetical protein
MRLESTAKALFALVLLTFFGHQAAATPCVVPPLSPAEISQFKANTQSLVAADSDTRTIEAVVRNIAGTDANLAAELVRLAEGTNPRFRTAIAAGLAQAAVACQTIDQQAALLIQQAVAAFEDGEFQNAFAAVAGDLSTAAVSAATSAASGSVGSVVVTNPNGSSGTTGTFGSGGATAFFQITSSTAAINTTPTTTITAASPVSATR